MHLFNKIIKTSVTVFTVTELHSEKASSVATSSLTGKQIHSTTTRATSTNHKLVQTDNSLSTLSTTSHIPRTTITHTRGTGPVTGAFIPGQVAVVLVAEPPWTAPSNIPRTTITYAGTARIFSHAFLYGQTAVLVLPDTVVPTVTSSDHPLPSVALPQISAIASLLQGIPIRSGEDEEKSSKISA